MIPSEVELDAKTVTDIEAFAALYTVGDIDKALNCINRLDLIACFGEGVKHEAGQCKICPGQWIYKYVFEPFVTPIGVDPDTLLFPALKTEHNIERCNAILRQLHDVLMERTCKIHNKAYSSLCEEYDRRQWGEPEQTISSETL